MAANKARKPFLNAVWKGALQHDHITICVLLYAKSSCSLLLVNVLLIFFFDQVHTRLDVRTSYCITPTLPCPFL